MCGCKSVHFTLSPLLPSPVFLILFFSFSFTILFHFSFMPSTCCVCMHAAPLSFLPPSLSLTQTCLPFVFHALSFPTFCQSFLVIPTLQFSPLHHSVHGIVCECVRGFVRCVKFCGSLWCVRADHMCQNVVCRDLQAERKVWIDLSLSLSPSLPLVA